MDKIDFLCYNKSIENIYDNLDKIGLKGATLKKITEGRDLAFMSKTLATIIRDVPIDFNFQDCEFGGEVTSCATENAYEILKKLDLNSIIKRLKEIADLEKIEITDEALYEIAKILQTSLQKI